MADVHAATANRPAWIDLSSADPDASRAFYAQVFGWSYEVSPDPQYGGYAIARTRGGDVAGIGVTQSPGQPTAWSVYIGTPDADELGRRVSAAGGTVVVPAFNVGDAGRMTVFQDPAGAFISAWQGQTMSGFTADGPGTYLWAELSARGIDRAITFYEAVFGWTHETMPMPRGSGYTRFWLNGTAVAGGLEMHAMVPAEVPSYWTVYFGVDDTDAVYARALEAGGREMVSPSDFPGGRFAIVADPLGAVFAIRSMG